MNTCLACCNCKTYTHIFNDKSEFVYLCLDTREEVKPDHTCEKWGEWHMKAEFNRLLKPTALGKRNYNGAHKTPSN